MLLGRSSDALREYSEVARIRQSHDPRDPELAGTYLALAHVCFGRSMSRGLRLAGAFVRCLVSSGLDIS